MSNPTRRRPTRAILAATLAASALCCGTAAASPPAMPQSDEGVDNAAPVERAPFKATTQHRFNDVEHWIKVFDDPARDLWQRPEEVVARLRIQPGMTVADLGAGTGYFCPYWSRRVGPTGSVLAVEVEPSLVEYLRGRAEREHLDNLTPILASRDSPRLPQAAVDLIAIVNTYHHIDARKQYFKRLASVLRPEGRIAVIDWKQGDFPVGPGPDHKIKRGQVVDEMQKAGYQLVSEWAGLPYQYLLVFGPQSAKGTAPH